MLFFVFLTKGELLEYYSKDIIFSFLTDRSKYVISQVNSAAKDQIYTRSHRYVSNVGALLMQQSYMQY